MLIDFNQHPDVDLNCDVCIVGSGAAGAVLYDILARTKARVVLLESGGLSVETDTQELNEGVTRIDGKKPKREVTDLVHNRLRCLGGTTGHWGGGCMPFDEVDFAARDWVSNSGWPIDGVELLPFYREAKRYVEISTDIFDEKIWNALGIAPPYKFNFNEVSTVFESRSGFLAKDGYLNWAGPVLFKKYLLTPEVEKSANLVVYNATLTNLSSNSAGLVQFGEVSNLKLQKIKVRAKTFVLASGGFENPRILLAANQGAGIGNETDCVGRYYLAKPYGFPADLVCPDKKIATELAWNFQYYKVGRNRGHLFLSFKKPVQKQHQLLNTGIYLLGEYDRNSAMSRIAMSVRNKLHPGNNPDSNFHFSDVVQLLSELDEVILNGYRKLTNKGVRAPMLQRVPLFCIQEQVPDRRSRISLTREKDRFGVNKLLLDWHYGKQDIENVDKVLQLLASTARDLGWGRIEYRKEAAIDSGDPFRGFRDAAHPSGATRMSTDPRTGVVDRNLKVHTAKNLYVCGSSVFPTNSHISPTYTIVALAVRLAEHLKKIMV